jgi:DNA helicase-2/ATP-dependent DNA helicase PcrA
MSDMTDRTPTDEQLAICDALGNRDSGNLMCKAFAGTGKSSTIALAAPRWRSPGIAVGFNKTTAETLKRILPSHFEAKSFNGLGHGVVARALGKKLTLEEQKLGKLIKEVAKGARMVLTGDQWAFVRNSVVKAMLLGVVPGNLGEPLTPDSPELWLDLASDAGADEEELEQVAGLAKEVLIRNNELTDQGIISFDDQVYYSAVLAPPSAWNKFPLVIGDEWQDANPLNHRQIARMCGVNTRLMLVGDPLQSIYAFRGSDPASMETSRSLRSQWTDLPLTMTFRCPKMVVRRQQRHAMGFRAWEGNSEGSFTTLGNDLGEWSWEDLPTEEPIAVICRNNAPLLSLAFKLIRKGIGVQMLGRDLGKGLVQLATKLSEKDDNLAIFEFCRRVDDWRTREIQLALANDRPGHVDSISDRAECLIASASASECTNVGGLKAMLLRLFEARSGIVTLSTIHQAKGKEWFNVVHLDPFRVPNKRAREAGGMVLQQELNALYVVETRTRNRLFNANMEDFV